MKIKTINLVHDNNEYLGLVPGLSLFTFGREESPLGEEFLCWPI